MGRHSSPRKMARLIDHEAEGPIGCGDCGRRQSPSGWAPVRESAIQEPAGATGKITGSLRGT
jgi:hypothetical protein